MPSSLRPNPLTRLALGHGRVTSLVGIRADRFMVHAGPRRATRLDDTSIVPRGRPTIGLPTLGIARAGRERIDRWKQVPHAQAVSDLFLAKARVQDLALKGYERAAPASHESQLAYGSPVFAAGGIPISHRCQSLPDNPYAAGEAEASDAP